MGMYRSTPLAHPRSAGRTPSCVTRASGFRSDSQPRLFLLTDAFSQGQPVLVDSGDRGSSRERVCWRQIRAVARVPDRVPVPRAKGKVQHADLPSECGRQRELVRGASKERILEALDQGIDCPAHHRAAYRRARS